MKIKIDKDIPISPKRGNGLSTIHQFPFGELKVGDSFVFPEEYNIKNEITGTKARNRAQSGEKKYKIKLVVRRQEDGDYRCWRTK